MNQNSSDSTPQRKPTKRFEKPRPDFPLSIHQGTGYWCKKRKGVVRYFGRVVDDPKGVAALEEYLRVKDDADLWAGGTPRTEPDDVTIKELVNKFLAHKELLRDNGELSPRTYQGYYATCAAIVATFGRQRTVLGISPDDFRKLREKLAKSRKAAVALRNEMQRVRSVFKFAYDDNLISSPVRFGPSFAKPKLEVVRRERERHRDEHGDRMFEACELRTMLAVLNGTDVTLEVKKGESGEPIVVTGKASPALRAMILLATNCGFGQTDLANLPTRAIDFEAGWLDFARVKTAIRRKIPLWPETIDAIQAWLKVRPKAKNREDDGMLFITRTGHRWVKLNAGGMPNDSIGQEFNKLLTKLQLKRSKVGFYAIRHGFETIAGETGDQVAVDAVMGHVQQGMSAAYRERIGDDRVKRVVDHVRKWLFDGVDDGDSSENEHADTISIHSDEADHGQGRSESSTPSLHLFVG